MPDNAPGGADTWELGSDDCGFMGWRAISENGVFVAEAKQAVAERIIAAMNEQEELEADKKLVAAQEKLRAILPGSCAPLGFLRSLQNSPLPESATEAMQALNDSLRETNAKLVEALEGALALLEMDGSRHNVWHKALDAGREVR